MFESKEKQEYKNKISRRLTNHAQPGCDFISIQMVKQRINDIFIEGIQFQAPTKFYDTKKSVVNYIDKTLIWDLLDISLMERLKTEVTDLF